MRGTLLIVGATLFVGSTVGCGGDGGGNGGGGLGGAPELDMSDFNYQDLSCEDDVPFDFTLSNIGDADAEDVTVQVGVRGEAQFSDGVGTVSAGQDVTVSGDFTASDDCFSTDPYTVEIALIPSNGDEADFTAAIAI